MNVDKDLLQQWKGPDDFFWRIKIKALEAAIEASPEQHVIYVDSDTFLYEGLETMIAGLDQGQTFMHLPETTLAAGPNRTVRQMWAYLKGRTILNYPINEQTTMWNAGVVALPKSQAKAYIEETLNLCDAFTATDCTRNLLEQLSFSMALNQHGKLTASDQFIGHYWGNKEPWNQAIQNFILKGFMQGLSLTEMREATAGFDFFADPVKGGGYRTRAKKLHRAVDFLIKRKPKTFFRDPH